MDAQRDLRNLLTEFGYSRYECYGDNFYNEDIFKLLSQKTLNEKGVQQQDRFRDIISDPNNFFIPRDDRKSVV